MCMYIFLSVVACTHPGGIRSQTLASVHLLPSELCPLSGGHLLWPYFILECVGIKRGVVGLLGIKRKVKV